MKGLIKIQYNALVKWKVWSKFSAMRWWNERADQNSVPYTGERSDQNSVPYAGEMKGLIKIQYTALVKWKGWSKFTTIRWWKVWSKCSTKHWWNERSDQNSVQCAREIKGLIKIQYHTLGIWRVWSKFSRTIRWWNERSHPVILATLIEKNFIHVKLSYSSVGELSYTKNVVQQGRCHSQMHTRLISVCYWILCAQPWVQNPKVDRVQKYLWWRNICDDVISVMT